MTVITFTKWNGPNGIKEFIENRTGCKPFSGAGINPRIEQRTTILKSVDNTYYYDDDLSDVNNVKYTLFGHNGDQDENEPKFNEPLLNKNKTQHIYLYRVRQNGKQIEYVWYGEYKISSTNNRQHIGKDYVVRNIIILSLTKID
jgi:hypothetical protein